MVESDSRNKVMEGNTTSAQRSHAAALSRRTAEAFGVVPFKMEDGVLRCLCTWNMSPEALHQLKNECGHDVSTLLVAKETWDSAFVAVYGSKPEGQDSDLIEAVSQAPRLGKTFGLDVPSAPVHGGNTKFLAITGGKGGVGKTTLTANLAAALAGQGFRVAAVDGDTLANLHVLFGSRPRHTLADVNLGKCGLHEALENTSSGVCLLAGKPGASESNCSVEKALDLRGRFDYVFIDTAAGASQATLDQALTADEAWLVLTPDPASVLDAYVVATSLLELNQDIVLRCVVNEVTDATHAKLVFAKFNTFLGLDNGARAQFAGYVRSDSVAAGASRERVPFVLAHPKSNSAQDVRNLARKIAGLPADQERSPGLVERLRSLFAA